MDIHDWLEKLGLSQYADVFVANHVCLHLLKELTGDDLRELGVTSLGHRKRLLHAISLLQEDVSPTSRTDRRQVAVLFADLCSFTQLARELGPEGVREVVDRFFAQTDEIITEHGGTVEKHMGDQAMAVFGALRSALHAPSPCPYISALPADGRSPERSELMHLAETVERLGLTRMAKATRAFCRDAT